MVVTFARLKFNGTDYNASFIDPSCIGSSNSSHILITGAFHLCDMNKYQTNVTIVYTNQITLIPTSNTTVINRRDVIKVDVRCEFPRHYNWSLTDGYNITEVKANSTKLSSSFIFLLIVLAIKVFMVYSF